MALSRLLPLSERGQSNPITSPTDLLATFRRQASELGFIAVGVAPAIESSGFSDLTRWIEAGYAGEMSYLADRLEAYRHPAGVLEGCRSVIALAYPYDVGPRTAVPPGTGRVARYAWQGDDYHDIIHPKLKRLVKLIRQFDPTAMARGVIDTAPIMEREIAQLAGLGWQGKNTLLINKHLGSYFFLACVLTDLELPTDTPHESSHCGTCTACLDACPTAAFPQPGVLDATRCISYLTIENRDAIADDLRDSVGDWAFGCDVCQEVCPWNRKAMRRDDAEQPEDTPLQTLELRALFSLDDAEFRLRFRKTPLWRTRRRGVLRNAALVLGNQLDPNSLSALRHGLADEDALVREASRWAIDKIERAAAH
ncbi:Epoxyqueuosine reductase [Novipirellula galeiformis]|uniref:Epoxyqueuosine reductase n=1 Tax=Novipirellula galeiformis TaxID=2528004 RepID=A0A5C6CNI2_9BACT|nr:Epoxyqueuosine reductase [Novipirellula galeiformis]